MNSSQSPKNAFEQLYGKPLTPQQAAEMKFNFADYIEALAEMDKQYKAKSGKQNNRGSDKSPKAIN